jgi:hypothetical protein
MSQQSSANIQENEKKVVKEGVVETESEKVTQLPTTTEIKAEGGGETIVTETRKVREEEGKGFLTTAVRGYETTNKWIEKEEPQITVIEKGGLIKESDKTKVTTKETEEDKARKEAQEKSEAQAKAKALAEAEAHAKAEAEATTNDKENAGTPLKSEAAKETAKSVVSTTKEDKKSATGSKKISRTGSKIVSREQSPKNSEAKKEKPVLVKKGSFTYVKEGEALIPHYMIPQDRTVVEKEVVIPEKHVMPFVPHEKPEPVIPEPKNHDFVREVVTTTVKTKEDPPSPKQESVKDHKLELIDTKVKTKEEPEGDIEGDAEKKKGKLAAPTDKEIVRQSAPEPVAQVVPEEKPVEVPEDKPETEKKEGKRANPTEKEIVRQPKPEAQTPTKSVTVVQSTVEEDNQGGAGRRKSEKTIDVKKTVATSVEVEETPNEIIETTTKTTKVVKEITTTLEDGEPVEGEPLSAKNLVEQGDDSIKNRLEQVSKKSGMDMTKSADKSIFDSKNNVEMQSGFSAKAKIIEDAANYDQDVKTTTTVTRSVKTVSGKVVDGVFVPEGDAVVTEEDITPANDVERKKGQKQVLPSNPNTVGAGKKLPDNRPEPANQKTGSSSTFEKSSSSTSKKVVTTGQTSTSGFPKGGNSSTTTRIVQNPDGSTTEIQETITETVTEEVIEGDDADIDDDGEDNNEQTTVEEFVTVNPDGSETKTRKELTTKVVKTVTEEIVEGDAESPDLSQQKGKKAPLTTANPTKTAAPRVQPVKDTTPLSSGVQKSSTSKTVVSSSSSNVQRAPQVKTVKNPDGSKTTTTTRVVQNPDGSTTEIQETLTETVTEEVIEGEEGDVDANEDDEDKEETTVEEFVTVNPDGSETRTTKESTKKVVKTVTEEIVEGDSKSSRKAVTPVSGNVQKSSMSKTVVSSSSNVQKGPQVKNIKNPDGSNSTVTTRIVENPDGSTTEIQETITETVTEEVIEGDDADIDDDGEDNNEQTTVEEFVTVNPDGSETKTRKELTTKVVKTVTEEIVEGDAESPDLSQQKGKKAPLTTANPTKTAAPRVQPVKDTTPLSSGVQKSSTSKTVVSSSSSNVQRAPQVKTVKNPDGSKTTTTTRVVQNPDGSTTEIQETLTETVTEEVIEGEEGDVDANEDDEDKEETTVEEFVTVNPDGSETRTTKESTKKVVKTVTEEIVEGDSKSSRKAVTPVSGNVQKSSTSKTVVSSSSNVQKGQAVSSTPKDGTNVSTTSRVVKNPDGSTTEIEETITETVTEEIIEEEGGVESPQASQHKGTKAAPTTSNPTKTAASKVQPAKDVTPLSANVQKSSTSKTVVTSSQQASAKNAKDGSSSATNVRIVKNPDGSTTEIHETFTETVTEEVFEEGDALESPAASQHKGTKIAPTTTNLTKAAAPTVVSPIKKDATPTSTSGFQKMSKTVIKNSNEHVLGKTPKHGDNSSSNSTRRIIQNPDGSATCVEETITTTTTRTEEVDDEGAVGGDGELETVIEEYITINPDGSESKVVNEKTSRMSSSSSTVQTKGGDDSTPASQHKGKMAPKTNTSNVGAPGQRAAGAGGSSEATESSEYVSKRTRTIIEETTDEKGNPITITKVITSDGDGKNEQVSETRTSSKQATASKVVEFPGTGNSGSNVIAASSSYYAESSGTPLSNTSGKRLEAEVTGKFGDKKTVGENKDVKTEIIEKILPDGTKVITEVTTETITEKTEFDVDEDGNEIVRD